MDKESIGKVYPSADKFKQLSKNSNCIVFSYKFFSDWLTPLSIYYSLNKRFKSESFLLESVEGEEKVCRFSFLGFSPICTFKNKGKTVYIKQNKKPTRRIITEDPLFELKKLLNIFKIAPKEKIRFFGGFVGYLGYDTIRFYESIGKELPDSLNTDDSYFVLPKILVIFDHLKQQIEILSFAFLEKHNNVNKVYLAEKEFIEKVYRMILTPHKLSDLSFTHKRLGIKSNFTKGKFIAAIKKIKKYIREGEVIQTVLSQRFSVKFKRDPLLVYRYLRILNPSPYMYYLNFGQLKVVGSSPEMLLRCENKRLVTRPIAGTRRRGKTESEDLILERALLSDPKEKAEHIMLVDLARNDLGRVAKEGTVKIPVFMKVEKFSHVMHIVSETEAILSDAGNMFDSLISCFPAGTVSGAPKVRAMQIINELEPDRRGIYAGTVGYFSFTKSIDTCIIIRTIVFLNGHAYIQAGAGIVADSKPENEYKEIISKAKAQILALEFAQH